MKKKIFSICIQILELIKISYCAKKERLYTANQHMLILCEKKSGAGWVDGWMGGRASLMIAFSNQKAKNGLIYKIQFFICIKIKFLWGEFYKEIANFGYFKKSEKN